MEESRKFPVNAIVAVLMLLVLGAGFYITAKIIDENNEAMKTQIDALSNKLSTTNEKLIEVHNAVMDMKRAAKVPSPTPAPAPAPPAPAK